MQQAWLVPFSVTAVGAVAAPIASKLAVRSAGPLYASIIESAATFATVGIVAGIALGARGGPENPWALGWAALGGVLWSLFVLGIYFTYAAGAPASSAMAALRAIAIAGTTLAAVILLGEVLTLRQWVGIGIIIAGIWMVLVPA